jgi:subtilase family serine protease
MSYGQCETLTSSAEAASLRAWAQQASAQGMTWFAASGDSGGADCYDGTSRSPAGLAVDLPAALPEVTGVGGTQLSEADGNYWNSSNDTNHASAMSYIPEIAWNDSTTGSPASSGGGASSLFAKPSWQTGSGVPADRARDVPDVALPASAGHDGYLFFTSGKLQVVGGTSAGAPTFAAIALLLNHYLVSIGALQAPGLGNMNPRLYSLAAANSSVFHDVTTGNNIVTACSGGRRSICTADPVGYSAGAGYDQVTGLGSVDAYSLITGWIASPAQ